MQTVRFVVERHPDGFVAYPLGIEGVVLGQGDTFDEAIADAKSVLAFHIESFGESVLEDIGSILDVTLTEELIAAS